MDTLPPKSGCKNGCKPINEKRNHLFTKRLRFYFAEREGFEPPVPLSTTVFKTVVIDHSTISPVLELLKSGCKGTKKRRKAVRREGEFTAA